MRPATHTLPKLILLGGIAGALGSCGDGDQITPPPKVEVRGHVELSDGLPAGAAMVTVAGIRDTEVSALRAGWRRARTDALKGKGLAPKASPLLALEGALAPVEGTTDANGDFLISLEVDALPIRIRAQVSLRTSTSAPQVENMRWGEATTNTLDLGTIVLPAVEGARMTIAGGDAQSADDSLRVANLGAEVKNLFGRAFDPDLDTDAFPGEFKEMGLIPLNSSVFLWMEALDENGDPVTTLSQAAEIRSRIPKTQWIDLEDITLGTDRIEIPIYTFDEGSSLWVQEAQVGWLEDGEGTVLPEDAQSQVLDGTYAGDLYATFSTGHFSWMNVDYPSIGPWTLSRLDRTKRNDDCLYDAMKLATAIARSAAGRNSYMKMNKPGGNLDVELADAAGPELTSGTLNNAFGEFKGNEQGDRDDQLYFDNSLWAGCGENATAEQKKNTTLLMAATLVHETAHWKWDVKHDDGNWTNAEPGGEAGNVLEKDVFGGITGGDANGMTLDGNPVPAATRDHWLDLGSWPPGQGLRGATKTHAAGQAGALALVISVPKTDYELGEEITVTVRFTNNGATAIRVLDTIALEGYPLWFEMVPEGAGSGARVPFRGIRAKRAIDWQEDFVSIPAGGSIERTINLLREAGTDLRQYNLTRSGEYGITAFYSGLWGLPETRSNTISIVVGLGGGVSGTVKNGATGEGIRGATINAIQGGEVVTSTVSSADGSYTIPELPGGVYVFEARAPGFLRSRVEGITITPRETSFLNFSLSPLLAAGQLRLILTWGESPSDLDSHLWLPAEKPYHVLYSRRGDLEQCPFAALDTDETGGLGPETITITDFFSGLYTYAVYNYSGSPDITTSSARVQVFDSTGMIAAYEIPVTGAGRWWKLLTIDGDSKAITELNEIVETAEPYGDTDLGCSQP